MKKSLKLLVAMTLLTMCSMEAVKAQPEYEDLPSAEALELIRHESALVGEADNWRSPLAEEFDGKKVKVFGRVTDKKVLPDGQVCLELGFYRSEHEDTNWKRIENYTVKVMLDQRIAAEANVSVNDFVTAYGIANIDYVWSNEHIDKRNQKSLAILANFQGNGRGTHSYSFEVRTDKISVNKPLV